MLLMITGFSNLCDPTNMTPPEGKNKKKSS